MDDSLSHTGVVQSVREGKALVAIATQGCSGCGQKSGCGIGKLAGGGRTTLVEVDAGGLRPGEAVTLTVGQDVLNRAALLGYLLPALLMVIGSAAGDSFGRDVGAVGGAVLGLAAGVLAVRILPRRVRHAFAAGCSTTQA